MPILPEEFDQFVADHADAPSPCAGISQEWKCRNPHWDGAGSRPARVDHRATDVPCDGPATLLVMINGTHAPSWGYPAASCPAHWGWALEHWKWGSQAPVGGRDPSGAWRLW